MTRVVIDTNVLVSALLKERGAEAAVLALVVTGKAIWCVSAAILTEYETVLSRHKFHNIERRNIAAALALAGSGQMTTIIASIGASPDEADNRFLECAEAAGADYLGTGNKRHFPKQWRFTRIVNANELLRLVR